MKKGNQLLFSSLMLGFLCFTSGGNTQKVFAESVKPDESPVTMYRLYNKNSGEHFYTQNESEKSKLLSLGWQDEGIGWYAPKDGLPVYRIYNKNAGDHHYTKDLTEKNKLVQIGWQDEGIGWNSSINETVPLYRAYNPNAKSGSHNYTVSSAEQKNLLKLGWRDEGIAWYGVSVDPEVSAKTTPLELRGIWKSENAGKPSIVKFTDDRIIFNDNQNYLVTRYDVVGNVYTIYWDDSNVAAGVNPQPFIFEYDVTAQTIKSSITYHKVS